MRRALLAAALTVAATTVSAQGIRCSAFLHDRDGTWRSFYDGTVLTERGPLPVASGERFSPTDRSARGDIARALEALCEPH